MSLKEALQSLQEKAEADKNKKARIEGNIESHMSHLNKLGISSIEKAKQEIITLKKRHEKLEKQIEEKKIEFEDTYGSLETEDNIR